MRETVSDFMDRVQARSPGEPEFHQAVREVVESVWPALENHPEFQEARVLDRMVEPERVIMFRVPWVDDAGEVHVNPDGPLQSPADAESGCAVRPRLIRNFAIAAAATRLRKTSRPKTKAARRRQSLASWSMKLAARKAHPR